MTSNGGFFHRSALICAVLMFGFIDAAHANFLDDIGDFFSGNAPEVTNHSECYSYATVAVIRSGDVQKNNCPLSGPRYGSDYNAHYFWCKGVTPETARAEGQARNDEVQACKDNVWFCSAYGDDAAEATHDNRLYNCGFTGPAWGEGGERHRSYCLSTRIGRAKDDYSDWPLSETYARTEAIKKCKARYSQKKVAFCNSYGLRAAEHAKTFKEKNCDPSQNTWARWDSDYDDHFAWCIHFKSMTASADAGNTETTARENAVIACVARGGGPAGLTPVVNRNSGAFGTPGKAVAPPTGVQTRVAPVATPRRPSMPRAPSIGSGGPSLAVSPNNSAMERLNPTGLSGNQGYVAPTTRTAPKAQPCDTCGSNRVMPSNDNVRPSPVVTPRPTPTPTPPPAPAPSFKNFDYGGMSEGPKARLPK